MYAVRMETRALKWLRSQNDKLKGDIGYAIHRLQEDPDSCDVKPLVGVKYEGGVVYRLRVGDYRVNYQIDKGKLVILVIHIGDRKEVYGALKERIASGLSFLDKDK